MDAVIVPRRAFARGCYVTSMVVLRDRRAEPGPRPLRERGDQAKYLPGVVAGEKVLAVCISEPEAGSDAGGMTTNARTVDGGFRIDGGKIYISRADVADLFILYTRFDGVPGARGSGTTSAPSSFMRKTFCA